MTDANDDMDALSHSVCSLFGAASTAISDGVLIQRANRQDKEFHFQNWFKLLLESQSLDFDEPGRNTYPDFRLVHNPVGYEIKGLGFPGRVADYDCNSQIPHGVYRGRHIMYVFGRYPAKPDTNEYSVFDLVLCHGSFLNADDEYVHKNKSIRGMGSYGDILLRDRKMYVAPTPYGLLDGVERQVTLVLPDSWSPSDDVVKKGEIVRLEAERVMCGYQFDLTTNELQATWRDNPHAGRQHKFVAYRSTSSPGPDVQLKQDVQT
ncbi:hypothetical protein [Synechococcus sp. PCC 7336]|uniref:hypothetical protein n=1 Tax=Synechococcus sp. PCC 7336 TaxID=195250 RepID=UPI0003621E85|nr:hypothetical protein [Synechococcus sp. PCC 7336]